MKRPLLTVALVFMAGILAGDRWPLPFWPLLAGTAILATLTLAGVRGHRVLIWLLVFLAGFTNEIIHSTALSIHDLRLQWSGQPAYVTVLATLPDTPQSRTSIDQVQREKKRTLGFLEVSALRRESENWTAATGSLVVHTPGELPEEFWARRQVMVSGIIDRPPGPAAPGLFDYRSYLARHGIHFELRASSPNDWQLAAAPAGAPPLSDRFRRWARRTLTLGFPEHDQAIELLCAMTLGWRTALNGEIAEPFMQSGTMHIFAISGLHISLIAIIFLELLQVFRLPKPWAALVLLPTLWFYTGVTGWQPSAVRSTVMMSVIVAGWSLHRPSDLLNSLGAAAFLLLVWDPQQLFQAGFQLSFAVVLSLALFSPWSAALAKKWFQIDPFLVPEKLPAWPRWTRSACRRLFLSAATSLAAWLGSIPLVAHYFHFLTPVSLLANLVVVPLSGWALMGSLASLLSGSWWPAGAAIFNHSAWLFMKLMVWFSQWSADLPGAWCHVRSPSTLDWILYYSVILALSQGWPVRKNHRRLITLGLGLLFMARLASWVKQHDTVNLSILNLSGGECLLVRGGLGGSSLVDCGDEDSVKHVTQPFLRAQGINQLDRFILSHGDSHNIAGARFLQEKFSPQQIILGPLPFRSTAYSRVVKEFEQDELVRIASRGEQVGPWQILHPAPEDRFSNADDGTLALRARFQGIDVLFLSDLGRKGQELLLQRTEVLQADIVIAGLPQRGEPLAEPLLEAISPQCVIITDSPSPASARASSNLQRRLANRAWPVIYTRETGGLMIQLNREGWSLFDATGNKMALATPDSTDPGQADGDVTGLGNDELLDFDEH